MNRLIVVLFHDNLLTKMAFVLMATYCAMLQSMFPVKTMLRFTRLKSDAIEQLFQLHHLSRNVDNSRKLSSGANKVQ